MDYEPEYGENKDGVHVMYNEYTLCGDAFDISSSNDADCGDIMHTNKKIVTCSRCIVIIKELKYVKYKENK